MFLVVFVMGASPQSTHFQVFLPGRVAQSVMCLATDASLTADPGVASSIPARSHTFLEIDHEIISTVILLPSAESFKKGCCQLDPCFVMQYLIASCLFLRTSCCGRDSWLHNFKLCGCWCYVSLPRGVVG